MCPVPLATPNWFDSHQYAALWIEGFALLAILIYDIIDGHHQHKQTLAQMEIMRNQARATETAGNAASKSAEALINSERAWIIVELVPQAVRASDNQWYRFVGTRHVLMSEDEILAGHHLRYKLKFTNMGRTPAQIFGFTLVYSCLGEGVTELPESGGGEKVMRSYLPFERWLGGDGQGIEIEEPIVDLDFYMSDDIAAIRELKKTAVIHGWVKYRHMFSTTEAWYSDFCYVYTVSQQRLTSVGRHTKQRHENAEPFPSP